MKSEDQFNGWVGLFKHLLTHVKVGQIQWLGGGSEVLMKQGQILWLFLLVVVQREDWTNFAIRAFSVLINSWNKIQAIIQLLIIFGPKSLLSGEISGRIFPDPVITFILYATRCETLRTLILSNRVLRYSGPETLHSGGF